MEYRFPRLERFDRVLTHIATALSQNSLNATRWVFHRLSAARSSGVSASRASLAACSTHDSPRRSPRVPGHPTSPTRPTCRAACVIDQHWHDCRWSPCTRISPRAQPQTALRFSRRTGAAHRDRRPTAGVIGLPLLGWRARHLHFHRRHLRLHGERPPGPAPRMVAVRASPRQRQGDAGDELRGCGRRVGPREGGGQAPVSDG